MLVMAQFFNSPPLFLILIVISSLRLVGGVVIPVDSSESLQVSRDFLARAPGPDDSYDFENCENGDDTQDSIDPDEGMPPSDRVLRPRVDWINEAVAQGDAQCIDENGNPTDDYDSCDNGGSGNCELCDNTLVAQTTAQKRGETGPRVINGNSTYRFLPGESMIVRKFEKRATLDLIFKCDPNDQAHGMSEVCQNMCFGLNCLKIKNLFTRETTKTQCSSNRKKNVCGKQVPNPCSPRYKPQQGGPPGLASKSQDKLSCDEFPFASTQEATNSQGSQTATRCVPARQNSRQGGTISALYRNKLQPGDSFTILFDYGNGPEDSTQGTSYCTSTPNCAPDTFQML